MQSLPIITVGFNPAWDRTCFVDGLEWRDHKGIAFETLTPAGKALNINKALAWMSIPSIAAGLWGSADSPEMLEKVSEYQGLIDPAFTVVEGHTRQNVTVADIRKKREFHLRSAETLVTLEALQQLDRDLQKRLNHLNQPCRVIFAGSLPDGALQEACISLIAAVARQGNPLMADTSSRALGTIVNQGGIGVIKPNLEEFSMLLGEPVENDPEKIISSAVRFCDRVEVVIVSLGAAGAVAVTKGDSFYCRVSRPRKDPVHTVGCGDYLLAGYLSLPDSTGIGQRLIAGIKAAAAKAWGWVPHKSWQDVQKEIEIELLTY